MKKLFCTLLIVLLLSGMMVTVLASTTLPDYATHVPALVNLLRQNFNKSQYPYHAVFISGDWGAYVNTPVYTVIFSRTPYVTSGEVVWWRQGRVNPSNTPVSVFMPNSHRRIRFFGFVNLGTGTPRFSATDNIYFSGGGNWESVFYYIPQFSTATMYGLPIPNVGERVINLRNVPPRIVNTTALQSLATQAENHPNTNYTGASWSHFQAMLNAARAVLNNTAATQTQVDTAHANLQAAFNALQVIQVPTNRPSLYDAWRTALNRTNNNYTPETWSEFLGAVAYVEAVLSNPEATEMQISAAISRLSAAQFGLMINTPPQQPNQPQVVTNAELQQAIRTGEFTAILRPMVDIVLAQIGAPLRVVIGILGILVGLKVTMKILGMAIGKGSRGL